MENNALRSHLRSEGRLLYSIMDFNLAMVLEPNADGSRRRLLWHCVLGGPCDLLFDVAQGELDYDPFALDVGLLGMVLRPYLVVSTEPPRSLFFE